MHELFKSASKIVFIMIAAALIMLTVRGIVEAKDFVVLASMVFTYYFTRPSTQSQPLG